MFVLFYIFIFFFVVFPFLICYAYSNTSKAGDSMGIFGFRRKNNYSVPVVVPDKQKEKREHKRISVLHPCVIYRMSPDLQRELNEDHGFLIDMSVGGACVESQVEYPQYSYVRLYLEFPECKPLSVYGCILRVTEVTNFGLSLYRYGMQFIGLNHSETELLVRKLNQIQLVSRKLNL